MSQKRIWGTHHGFALLDILLLEQKLTVEIGNVDCVQVKQCDFAKPSKNNVLH